MLSEKDIKKTKQLFEKFKKDFEKDPNVKKIKDRPKMWVDDDGIIHTELKGDINSAMKYTELMIDYAEKNKDKKTTSLRLRALTKIPPTLKMPSLEFRKKTAEYLKRSQANIKFQKAALCGGGIIAKTVFAFILRALGMKNVKHFTTEEEALKWLKKD